MDNSDYGKIAQNSIFERQKEVINNALCHVMNKYQITIDDAPKRIAIQHHPHGIYLAVDGNIVTDNLKLKVVIN